MKKTANETVVPTGTQRVKGKLDILHKLDCSIKAADVCKEFNLSQSTLSMWKKQRPKLKDMIDAGKVLKTKCNRESFLPQVERALHLWFCEMRSKPHAPHHSTNSSLHKRWHSKYSIVLFCCFYFVWHVQTYVNVKHNTLYNIKYVFNLFDKFDIHSCKLLY